MQSSEIEAQMLMKQEDEADRKMLKKEQPNMAIDVTINDLIVSFVAKVQVSRSEEVLIDENRELALFTWKGIKFTSDQKPKEKKHKVNFRVNHFQIDNQSE